MRYMTREQGGPGIEWAHGMLHLENDWEQLRGGWNWRTWHLVFAKVEVELDHAIPGWEVTLKGLGLGFRLRINGDWSKTETGRGLLEAEGMDTWEHCPTCGWGRLKPNPDAAHGPK